MEREEIRFHVLVTIYKTEAFLAECIESVLAQTYQNFELVLVDNGSPDRCGEICEAYAAKDPRVRVFHKPHGGIVEGRQYAIAHAEDGGYGVFLDSDDTLYPHALETIAKTIKISGCDCVIYGAERVLEGKFLYRLRNVAEEPLVIRDKRLLYRHMILDCSGDLDPLWRKAARMNALKNGRDYARYGYIGWGEDRLQSLDIYKNCESFYFLPDVLYGFRMNPISTSSVYGRDYANYRADYSVQQAEEAFLQAEGVFTAEDFNDYHHAAVVDIANEAGRIAQMRAPRKVRAAFLEEVRTTEFVQKHLGGAYDRKRIGKLALVYELFRRKQYNLLLLTVAAYTKLRTLRT